MPDKLLNHGMAPLDLLQNHSPAQLKQKGIQLYKKKKYEDALLMFNAALHDQPVFDILDNRAATLTRLKRFDLALKDGRDMCKMDPDNVVAYLRTGKILELMKKDDVALKIYQRGIHRLPQAKVQGQDVLISGVC